MMRTARRRAAAAWLAVGILALGFAITRLWSQAPGWLYGVDFGAYLAGAGRLAADGTPYHPALYGPPLANVAANVPVAYLYPPLLAQALAAFPMRDAPALIAAWVAAQVILLGLVLPLVARRYAPEASRLERVAVVVVFAATSWPLHFALFVGNVGGWVAIGVAILLIGGGPARGVAASLLTLLKAVPVPFLLVALASRPSRVPAVAALVAGVAFSFMLSPQSWSDWLRAWPHIAAMLPGPPPANISPAIGAAALGLEPLGRAAGLVLAAGFAVAGVFLAHVGRWPAAVVAATLASLFVPPTLWDHHLAPLVPLVIAAWWVATTSERIAIGLGWAVLFLMWVGPLLPVTIVLVWVGALLLVGVASLRALRRVSSPGAEAVLRGASRPP